MSFRQDRVLEFIDCINKSGLTRGMVCKFDELNKNKDSICVSISDDDTAGEVFADVTGTAKSGKIKLEIFYRVVSAVQGVGDVESVSFLEELTEYVITKLARTRVTGGYLESIEWLATPRLYKVYSGNIRDFVTKIQINYERMVK